MRNQKLPRNHKRIKTQIFSFNEPPRQRSAQFAKVPTYMLKASLHCHTGEEPKERLSYTAYELINRAAELHFDVVAFTCHTFFFFPKEIQNYAAKKNILLIPGIEQDIERKKHVLILNATPECEKIRTFKKLAQYKANNNCLIIAPHPFYRTYHCLKKKLIKHIDLFDAIEFSFFYSEKTNWNKKAIETARKYQKPLLGTSDVHFLEYINMTYSLIEAEKNIPSIFEAIRKNRIAIKTEPLRKGEMSKLFFKMSRNHLRRIGRKIKKGATVIARRSPQATGPCEGREAISPERPCALTK